jgi:hypothetical protein
MVELDRRGVPGCMVATVEFADAVAAQAKALGFAPAFHLVPHPVQSLTMKELAAIADAAVPELLPLISERSR